MRAAILLLDPGLAVRRLLEDDKVKLPVISWEEVFILRGEGSQSLVGRNPHKVIVLFWLWLTVWLIVYDTARRLSFESD